MWNYVMKDMMSVVRFLPAAFGVSVLTGLILKSRRERGRTSSEGKISVMGLSLFLGYLSLLLCITYFSREIGSVKHSVDFHFFSTWGINRRNNAFVVENVLLFIPYGILGAWAFVACRRMWSSFLLGFLTSLAIETLQLITGRGYFQVDDILTNVAGHCLGMILFYLVHRLRKLFRRRE